MTPPVVCIVGRSGSGKTTLLERLIPELKRRGWRVGSAKHVHEFTADTPGKDSWRHAHAGSDVTAIVGSSKVALIHNNVEGATLEDQVPFMGDVDIVLGEGFKQEHWPKVEVARSETGCVLVSPPEELLCVVTDAHVNTSAPVFSLDDVGAVADLLEERSIRPSR